MWSGDILRMARLAAGLTQAEAADLHGISRTQWGNWERGDVSPRRDTRERVEQWIRDQIGAPKADALKGDEIASELAQIGEQMIVRAAEAAERGRRLIVISAEIRRRQ